MFKIYNKVQIYDFINIIVFLNAKNGGFFDKKQYIIY